MAFMSVNAIPPADGVRYNHFLEARTIWMESNDLDICLEIWKFGRLFCFSLFIDGSFELGIGIDLLYL